MLEQVLHPGKRRGCMVNPDGTAPPTFGAQPVMAI